VHGGTVKPNLVFGLLDRSADPDFTVRGLRKGQPRARTPAFGPERSPGTATLRVELSQASTPKENAMAKQKTLDDLFFHTLKDIYYAERKILKSLPRMAKAVDSDELRQAFEKHRDETQGQIERLEQIFEMLGKRASGKTCEAINGILEEGESVMEEFDETEALDPAVLAAAQAVEHYEISRYGTLKTWARELGLTDAVKLIEQTLQEEKKADELLSKLAENRVNQKAA
jgi:ferritin-like metal-binding protein YciE